MNIEQLIHRAPHDCRWRTTSGYSFSKPTPTGTRYVHASCNQLRCRSCASQFYHDVHPRLCQAFHDHSLQFLVSLTLPGDVPPESQESILKDGLRRLLLYARRTFSGSLHYAWVIGAHNGGALHIHMVVNLDIRRASQRGRRQEWLRRTWHHLTGAFQVSCKPITPGSEAQVVQYLLENLFEAALHRCVKGRRYGSSRSIRLRSPRRSQDPDGTWTRHRHPTAFYARLYNTDSQPILNAVVDVNDALASSTPRPGSPPLHRAAAGGASVPAGGRAGVGVPVPSSDRLVRHASNNISEAQDNK